MPDYDNTNKGVLFPNQYKEEGDSKPDYLGNVNVNGEEWSLAAWANTSKNGKDYLGVRVSEPREKSNGQQQQNSSKDTDDSIPF
jgi:uncharacterized protein (DUF736 family)